MQGFKEAPTRFELVIAVLQTDALPLGYGAICHKGGFLVTQPAKQGDLSPYFLTCNCKSSSPSRSRTYDTAVNSRVLYRLSYRGIINQQDRLYKKAAIKSIVKNHQLTEMEGFEPSRRANDLHP